VESLVPIGRFSKMCRLSVKALRHYDEIGLLEPAVVDPSSGYRYYRLSQANRAEAIRILRSLDMRLEDIREILVADDPGVAAKILDEHRGRLETELHRHRRMLELLERLIAREEGLMPYEVKVKEVPPATVVRKQAHVSLANIGEVIGGGIGEVFAFAAQGGVAPAGAPLVVYLDQIDEESDGDIEICLPVTALIEGEGGIDVAELEGGPVAFTVHRGPYSEIGPAYHALFGWIAEHGHETAGPPREVYLTDPAEAADPADNVTEIDWPIR
jgi:effector-binding domain-containing protein